jgi:dihydroorotate dehydrogenase
VYKSLIRPLIFQLDSELAHNLFVKAARGAELPIAQKALKKIYAYEDPRLEVGLFGFNFASPLGLAAGFDKNCEAFDYFSALGFAFIEVGTVTSQAQPGNPRPRIFRIPESRAIINRMGFPSEGMSLVKPRLARAYNRKSRPVIGVNIGKLKSVSLDDAARDYQLCFRELRNYGDYFVLNVSSPNTPELRRLQEPERLKDLLQSISELNKDKKPVLLKIAPDLEGKDLADLIKVCASASVDGIVATNTTFSRNGLIKDPNQTGGLSGEPLRQIAIKKVRYISDATAGTIPIIGVGGISTAADVVAMLQAGARLVQLYTAFIYEGPSLVRKIKQDLSLYLDRNGIAKLSDLTGPR